MTSRLGQLPHDGGMDFDGNLYYTVNAPNRSSPSARSTERPAKSNT